MSLLTEFLLLGLSVLLMLACGVFVAAEFSFVTVDRASVEREAEAGDSAAAGLLSGLRTLSTQLSGAQLGITLTNLVIGYLSEPALASLLRPLLADIGVLNPTAVSGIAIALALIISTLVTMLLGELIPKNLAIAVPMRTAKASQWAMRGFTKAMAWPIRFLNGAANAILRRMGIEPQEELRSARNPEELRSLVRRSADEGVLAGETATLVDRSIAFGNRTAADVCVPRVKVRFLDGTQTATDLIRFTRETGHSRFPVIDDNPDEVIGVAHVKQAVAVPLAQRDHVQLTTLAARATVVPATMELDPLLTVLRHEGMQMAVVIDEYGGTDGLVTLEDLIEEIVGDIADEHDRLASAIRVRRDGSWLLSGLLRPDEVADQTGIRLPESVHAETIAGQFTEQLGRLPQPGDEVRIAASTANPDPDELGRVPVLVNLRAERVERRRLDRISMIIVEPATPDRAEQRR